MQTELRQSSVTPCVSYLCNVRLSNAALPLTRLHRFVCETAENAISFCISVRHFNETCVPHTLYSCLLLNVTYPARFLSSPIGSPSVDKV